MKCATFFNTSSSTCLKLRKNCWISSATDDNFSRHKSLIISFSWNKHNDKSFAGVFMIVLIICCTHSGLFGRKWGHARRETRCSCCFYALYAVHYVTHSSVLLRSYLIINEMMFLIRSYHRSQLFFFQCDKRFDVKGKAKFNPFLPGFWFEMGKCSPNVFITILSIRRLAVLA